MMPKYIVGRSAKFVVLIAALILAAPIPMSRAQGDGLNLVQTGEYDLGVQCPVASTLDSTGTTLWVLMNGCGQFTFKLRAFNLADGSPVNVEDYADALAGLANPDIYVDPFINPLAFTPDGDLSIRYTDIQTSGSFNLRIPLATGGETTTEADEAYDAFLADYSEYPDFSVYSSDHTRVVATGETSFHILDVQTQTEIVEIPVEGGTGYSIAMFSADGERLEVTSSNNLDDPTDHASTLLIYSLPDGELLQQYQVPSTAIWVSPDGTYAAVNLYSNNTGDLNELVVIELATGLTSAAFNLDEDPVPVTTCVNDGHSVSELGYMTDGRFSFPDLRWLPDSSGFVLPLSYGGDGALRCIFNTSRLRSYKVQIGD
jgi:hypothetical protein